MDAVIVITALVIGFGFGWVVMGWFGGSGNDLDSVDDYDRDERYSLSSKLTKMMEEDELPTLVDLNNFEAIWVAENCKREFGVAKRLSDDKYIEYSRWEEVNWQTLYKKHLPDTQVFRGVNPNTIFHGGCLGCVSQAQHGVDRCKGCQYFKANWNLKDLTIKGDDKPQKVQLLKG